MINNLKRAGIVGALLTFGAHVLPAQSERPDTVRRDSSHSIQAQASTSPQLAAVLTRSCGDCHSNAAPARPFRAPLSWIMSRAASAGRKAVNFSEWASYTPEQQRKLLLSSCADATKGKMPEGFYLRFRDEARLSTTDVETICSAARESSAASATVTSQARKDP